VDSNPSVETPDNEALHGPVGKVFVRYLIPSLVGILAMTTANIVDGVFIGNYVGVKALAAINLILPVLSLLFGVGLMLSIGGSIRAGKYLGEGNNQAASAIFSKTLVAVILYGIAVIALGLSFETQLFRGLGAKPDLFPMMHEYFFIIMPFLLAQLGLIVLYFFIRLDGFPTLTAIALVSGSLLNILLDYLFIAEYGWGLQGAALATGISQVLPMLVLMSYFLLPKRSLIFSLKQRNWGEVWAAAYNGISEFINEISAGVVAFIFNWILIQRAGVEGVAAITVVNYLLMLGVMVFFSVADASQVLISQNFGARNSQRIKRLLWVAQGCVVVVSACLIGLLLLKGDGLIGLFIEPEESQATLRLAQEFVTLIWPLFLFAGSNMLISGYLTAIHHPYQSALLATSRSLILPVGLLLLLSWLLDGYLFVFALPLAELITFLLAMVLFIRHRPSRVLAS
jgi:putative MATE family efflux protein